jgi:hypothetical protein
MKKISRIYYHFLRDDEHGEYMTVFNGMIRKFPAMQNMPERNPQPISVRRGFVSNYKRLCTT